MSPAEQAAAGCVIGEDYPAPRTKPPGSDGGGGGGGKGGKGRGGGGGGGGRGRGARDGAQQPFSPTTPSTFNVAKDLREAGTWGRLGTGEAAKQAQKARNQQRKNKTARVQGGW